MNTDKDGGNAFPVPGLQDYPEFNGMSLRDYFAAKAMQGEVAASTSSRADPNETAEYAYRIADAMLAARGET